MGRKKELDYPLIGGYAIQIIGRTLRYGGCDVAELLSSDASDEFIDWLIQADCALKDAALLRGKRNTEEWQRIPEAMFNCLHS